MYKSLRVVIAILLALGVVVLAWDQVAWAQPGSGVDRSPSTNDEQSMSQIIDSAVGDKDKDKCKKKDKDDDGTVKPPDDCLKVCKRGEYSVGGTTTIDVKNLRNRDCLLGFIEDPATVAPSPGETFLSDVLTLQLPAGGAKVKICFAAPPGSQDAKIRSFVNGVWKSIKTKVKNGMACTEVSRSGAYTLVGQ